MKMLILLIIILFLIPAVAIAYTPPMGIPEPTFGIDETYRIYDTPGNRNGALSYTQNSEGGYFTHYIDNSDENSTDTDNDYGSVAIPRKTLPTTLAEGAVVEIHNSIGDGSSVTCSGTASKPIFVRGYSSGDKPLIQDTLDIRGSYSIWENLELDASGRVWIVRDSGSDASYISIRDNEIYGDGETDDNHGITITTNNEAGDDFTNIVIYNNHVHHRGDSETEEENDIMGVAVGSKCDSIWIVDNEFNNMGGDSFQGNSADGSCNNIYIGRNTMHDDNENAVDVKLVDGIVVSENTIYGYDTDQLQAIVTHNGATNVWIIFNEIYSAGTGIANGSVIMYVCSNIIYNCSSNATSGNCGGATYYINNTIYNCGGGIVATGTGPAYVINNIITELSDYSNKYHLQINGVLQDDSVIKNSCFYQTGQSVKIEYDGTYDVAGFQVATEKGQNCIEDDPLFTDSGSNDFTLQSGSPAIDAGMSDDIVATVLNTFATNFGVSIRYDIVNEDRVPPYDMGAYENNTIHYLLALAKE